VVSKDARTLIVAFLLRASSALVA